ncbi:MAG: hypothetical protein KUG82_02930 [Pseudomonadales bacterium]|nr:hypothetical protein [Pseudomonadales bacterium]
MILLTSALLYAPLASGLAIATNNSDLALSSHTLDPSAQPANEDPTEPPPTSDINKFLTPCTTKITGELSWLDRTHTALSRQVCNQAKRFDRFFGDINYETNDATSFIRIRNSFIFKRSEDSNFEFAPRIKARIYLPSARQRINLIISDDTENQDSISSSTETTTNSIEEKKNVSTALRWVIPYIKFVKLDVDVGARFNNGFTTFVKLRSRKRFQIDERGILTATGTLFWIDHEGFGERTQLDYEQIISKNYLLRWTSAGNFSQSTKGIDYSQRITLYQQFDKHRAMSYYIGMNGSTRPYPLLEEYGLGVRYRKDIHHGWLFLEIEPELFWPSEEDRDTIWRFTVRLEAQFGQRRNAEP